MDSRRRAALVSVASAVVVLGGVYVVLQDRSQTDVAEGPKTFRLNVTPPRPEDESRPIEDFPVFVARQGDEVTLVAHAEIPGSLHLHIYEKEIPLVPGGDAMLTFTADVSGRFPVHLHDSSGKMYHLATLEVEPR